MPLTRNQKVAAGVLVGLGVLGLAGAAKAADDDTDDGGGDLPPCPNGFHRVPTVDGGSICVPDVVVPADDGGGGNYPDPPDTNVCDFSGCGFPFDTTHLHPSVYALRFQELGYPMNVGSIAANGSMIAVSPARDSIEAFQVDYNALRVSNGLNGPAALVGPTATNALNAIKNSKALSTDGLNGNNTIAAVVRAKDLVAKINMSWANIINLA